MKTFLAVLLALPVLAVEPGQQEQVHLEGLSVAWTLTPGKYSHLPRPSTGSLPWEWRKVLKGTITNTTDITKKCTVVSVGDYQYQTFPVTVELAPQGTAEIDTRVDPDWPVRSWAVQKCLTEEQQTQEAQEWEKQLEVLRAYAGRSQPEESTSWGIPGGNITVNIYVSMPSSSIYPSGIYPSFRPNYFYGRYGTSMGPSSYRGSSSSYRFRSRR